MVTYGSERPQQSIKIILIIIITIIFIILITMITKMYLTLLVNGSYELGSVALHAIGGCVANIHSPINSQCRARHRSTKPSRAMANRGLSEQTPPQTDKLRYQWQGRVVNTLVN